VEARLEYSILAGDRQTDVVKALFKHSEFLGTKFLVIKVALTSALCTMSKIC